MAERQGAPSEVSCDCSRQGRWKRRHGPHAQHSSSRSNAAEKETGSFAADQAEVGFWVESALPEDAEACLKAAEEDEEGVLQMTPFINKKAAPVSEPGTPVIAENYVSDEFQVEGTSDVEPEDSSLTEELEFLRAMWPNEGELCIDYPAGVRASVTVQFEPFTAGESLEQFVHCQLAIAIPKSYPHVPLAVSIGNSRGLSAGQEAAFLHDLTARAAELVGEPALYLLLESGKELLTACNAPTGDCSICLRELGPAVAKEAEEETASNTNHSCCTEVARTPCFHAFHTKCLASYWQSEWERQLQDHGKEGIIHIHEASVLCPECRTKLLWEEMPQLHAALEDAESVVRESIHQSDTISAVSGDRCQMEEQMVKPSLENMCDSTNSTGKVATAGRRQRRRQAKDAPCTKTAFVWSVEIQNSDTAHAATTGSCSIRLVAVHGESEEIALNQGGGMKSGELVTVEVQVANDLGDLVYVELKNTSAETWRPHWIKVFAPDGKENFIFSRQWVAKGRTQKAYAEVSGAVGMRGLPSKTGNGKFNSARK